MDFSFNAFDNPAITMRVSVGAYYFDGKPVYIVEHIEEDLNEYVLVYEVHDSNEIENPIKAFTTKEVRKTIPGGTLISNLIKSRLPNKVSYKRVNKDPLFVSNIIPIGTDTVTGKTGKGFFERTPDRTVTTQKEGVKVINGTYTGVFITLSNIKWFKSYTPLESVVQYYKKQRDERINV